MAAGGPGGDDHFDDDFDDDGALGALLDDAEFRAALAELAHWAGQDRVDDAVRRRRRSTWLGRQATEEASLVGVVADLAERGRPVVLGTAAGRRHRGLVAALGRDVLVVSTAQGQVWLALRTLAWVRTPPGEEQSSGSGGRPQGDPAGLIDLAGELGRLSDDRSRLSVRGEPGGEPLVGTALAVGRDVLTLRDDGGGLIYVALASVAEVSLPESG
jgi:hypothetical protein